MSNNKQQVELTDITSPLLAATQGLTMEDRDASIGLLLDFAERGRNRGEQRPPSICKVPSILRDLSVSSFIPQLVSIGPIHRENPKLQEFDRQKECYLNDLLNRCYSTPKETLEACLERINDLIPRMRESYNAGVIEKYSDGELARMMVMDGCFILEFCFKHDDEDLYLPNKMQNTRIAMDLMLLENQVPFSVLQALFECSMGEVDFTLSDLLDTYLAPYIKLFCSLLREKVSTTDVDLNLPKKSTVTDVDSDSTPAHVLGYLHKRYQLVTDKSSKPIHAEAYTVFHSIVELDRSGMNFKPHQEDGWSMTIKFQSSLFACLPWFWSKPTLLMPVLVIDDTTELILRNFIAYEQSFPQGRRRHVSTYAKALSMLIDSQEDIAKLVESKVLVNTLSSNQEAADMINKICKNVFVTGLVYIQAFEQMDKYYYGYWPQMIAWLRRNIALMRGEYRIHPWNCIALVAAIILFLVTVVQTLFTVLGYFADRSNQ